jgi:hypothetical protein
MVWFGKHSVAYVIYVPAALAGLLVPYAWAFAGRGAAQSTTGALPGLSPARSRAAEGQNGHLQNGTMQNGSLQNGKVESHAPSPSFRSSLPAQLQRRRLSEALLGECCAHEESLIHCQLGARKITASWGQGNPPRSGLPCGHRWAAPIV